VTLTFQNCIAVVVTGGMVKIVVSVKPVNPVEVTPPTTTVVIQPTSREVVNRGNVKVVEVVRVLGGNTKTQGGGQPTPGSGSVHIMGEIQTTVSLPMSSPVSASGSQRLISLVYPLFKTVSVVDRTNSKSRIVF
jgi:hypothetical protein